MAQAQPLAEIEQLYNEALADYDFFEFDSAEQKLKSAIELAKKQNLRDPLMAKVHVAYGIVFHARFKDAAPAVAEEKTFDEFVAAVTHDYQVEIPADYRTSELNDILKRARDIVPPPMGDGKKPVKAGAPPTIRHDALPVADACKPVTLRANVPPHSDVFRVYAYYITTQFPTYQQVELSPAPNDPALFIGQIPFAVTVAPTVDYYIEVVDRQQQPVATAGSRSRPYTVTIIGNCDLDDGSFPLVQINLGVGSGLGFASGDSERCKLSADCYGDDPERFGGVRSGLAPAPFHIRADVVFNVIKELQIGAYLRYQIVEPGFMVGAIVRYLLVADEPYRFYTGIGGGYGKATTVVNLGPEFNNFRDIVNLEGPAHIAPNFGFLWSFHDNVGLFVDLMTPIHFPDFTFHFDLSLGPFFQF